MAVSYILSSKYFTDIQEKAMIGMKVIPSVFLQSIVTMEPSKIAKAFHYFEDDLPHPGTLESELHQWLVSLLFKYTLFMTPSI